MIKIKGPIAFQGALGANSDMACRAVFTGIPTLPCIAFEDVFAAVREGRAERAMIVPVFIKAQHLGAVGPLLQHHEVRARFSHRQDLGRRRLHRSRRRALATGRDQKKAERCHINGRNAPFVVRISHHSLKVVG